MNKTTTAKHVWIQLLSIICFFILFTCVFPKQASFAEEIEIPETAIDVTENDFPLERDFRADPAYYRFTPEKDCLVSHSRLQVFQVQGDKCISIEKEKVFDNSISIADNYYLESGYTYYIYIDTYEWASLHNDIVTITLDGNGGNVFGSEKHDIHVVANTQSYSSYQAFKDYTLRDGYILKDWNTKPDGTGFAMGEYTQITKDITFYALWYKTYDVTLDANGGYFRGRTVDPDTDDYKKKSFVEVQAIEDTPGYGARISLNPLDKDHNDVYYNYIWNPPVRDGYRMKEYNTSPDGRGISYGDGFSTNNEDSYNVIYTEDIRLYAIWICTDENHNYSDWKTVKAPTYTEDGRKEKTCSICGNIVGTSIPKLEVKGTSLLKPVAAKRAITVKWKKGSNISGYEIQYGLKKNFSGAKKIPVKKASIKSKKLTKLKAKKKYYIRIRTYKTVNGVKYYSKWSAPKYIKTK